MTSYTEDRLAHVIEQYLRAKGFVVDKEVPMMSKKVDIAAVKPRGRTVIAIELKVSDWTKALSQALTYQLWAHESYIALWAYHGKAVNASLLRRHGVGFFVANGGVRRLVRARPSNVLSPERAQMLRERILAHGRPKGHG